MCLTDLSHIHQGLYSLMFKKIHESEGQKMGGDGWKTRLFGFIRTVPNGGSVSRFAFYVFFLLQKRPFYRIFQSANHLRIAWQNLL